MTRISSLKASGLALSLLISGALSSCGSQPQETFGAASIALDLDGSSFLSDEGLKLVKENQPTYKVRVTASTFLKRRALQSSDLSEAEKCFLEEGSELIIEATNKETSDHIQVRLKEPLEGCNLQEAYLYIEHVELNRLYFATLSQNTVFKAQPIQSVDLSESQKCLLNEGQVIELEDGALETIDKHFVMKAISGAIDACAFVAGYVYSGHIDSVDVGSAQGFGNVIPHILTWEGGCSDHPNDPGGRTFMGITTARARQNGWLGDVCNMPEAMVLSIYRKDYWETRPHRYPFPLDLAVMNTEVNSGGGKAQEFVERMRSKSIQGDTAARASWFVDQQTQYYRDIAYYNPRLRVFLKGWLNRSAYMQDVIAGKVSFSLQKYLSFGTAKAYDEQ